MKYWLSIQKEIIKQANILIKMLMDKIKYLIRWDTCKDKVQNTQNQGLFLQKRRITS